jgi:F-type H+-transporting ATPase subunit delta
MNESQISVRYAKALFESASDRKVLDKVYRDMELLGDTCRLEDFQYMLTVPTLQPSQKFGIMDSILKDYISEVSLSLIKLVVQNRRELYLPRIARNFMDLYRKNKGISSATLVTAGQVDEGTLKRIRGLIAKAYDSEIELGTSVDKELIGGFVLTVEGLRYDASVASNLQKMKKQLLQTRIENK